ncbi:NACHT domain-containing protein [Saccharopolyspora aridisoli]|uniref:NACHT domain-containing protein n=1 Tax=Saccharopolyspora aridisoli TaxID=2530385 RepID=UPI0014054833|nr:NACHT domain-containing protein [Saccharopolyspora aridisoli]
MAKGYEIHNHSSGQSWNNAQIGVNHGNIWLTSPPGSLGVDVKQAELLQRLADTVREASADGLTRWGLRDRDALPVRWRIASEDLFDYWEKIQLDGAPPLLEGQFTAIRQTYEAVESRRLVILGRAGAGKTVLAHRLILDLLKNSPTGSVPMLFSLADWNPSTELRHWLTERLIRDYPFLNYPNPNGAKPAERFIARGLILPVLDGFDEIPEEHHSAAIRGISNLDMPLIVTSRPNEYARAAHQTKAVSGAAAIILEDITLDDAKTYLLHSTGKTRAPAWEAVFTHLRTSPYDIVSRNLTAVLTSPLMITLARTVYNDTPDEPGELLNGERFPTAEALENHLLDAYLRAVYTRRNTDPQHKGSPNWNPDQARRWLSYLANHLISNNAQDLAWWKLSTALNSFTRILVTAATVGFVPILAITYYDGLTAPEMLLTWPTYGLALGAINDARFARGRMGRDPERLRILFRSRSKGIRPPKTYLKNSWAEFTSAFAVGLACGLAVGLYYFLFWIRDGLTYGLSNGIIDELAYGFTHGLLGGLIFGITAGTATGIANILVSAMGENHTPQDAVNPWHLLKMDRTVTLARSTAAAATTGLTVGLVFGFTNELGLLAGLVGGTVRLMLSAWGTWLLFVRLWLPLTRRLPWRSKCFLEDAYDLGVMRRTGVVYQFRHARLRDHLATPCRT